MNDEALFVVGDVSPVIADCKRVLGMFRISEVFTTELEQRIRGLQWCADLPAHGRLDRATLDRLGVEYDVQS